MEDHHEILRRRKPCDHPNSFRCLSGESSQKKHARGDLQNRENVPEICGHRVRQKPERVKREEEKRRVAIIHQRAASEIHSIKISAARDQ